MTDSNLVGTSFAGTNTKDLKLQLYIESDDGTKIEGIGGENTKVKEIHLPVYKASEKQAEYEDGYNDAFDQLVTDVARKLKSL